MAYNPKQKYLFAPDQWDTNWRSALRASATTPVGIACIADSFAYGDSQLTNFMTQPWWTLFRADLLSKYTQGGDFWLPSFSQEYLTQFSQTFFGTPPFSSINATNRSLVGGNQFGAGVWWSAAMAATNLWTFTTPYACTDIDIITLDWATGNWTYTVDGGATQTVTIASVTSPQTFRRTQITGLSNTTHTVVCTGASAGFAHMLSGVATYKSRTTGLRFGWCHTAGFSAATYVAGSIPTGNGQWYVWQGQSGASATGFGFPSQPDLAIIALGINDSTGGGYPIEGYQAAMRKLCQALRRGKQDCSILFVANSNPDGDNSELTTTFVNANQWPLYIDRMLNIAIDYNCALVNFHAKWGELGLSNGFQTIANPHPTVNGCIDINATLAAIL